MANVITAPPDEAALASVTHDDRTEGGLPLPHFGNSVSGDIDRLRASLILLDGLLAGAGPAGGVRAMINSEIAALKGGAPSAYDTLIEIADKLGDNDDAIAAILAAISTKASQDDVAESQRVLRAAIAAIPVNPHILPITMTEPAAGATNVGAGGTYTFVARAFAGDTSGFYSNYGVAVASRFVNVYEPGGTVPVKTFMATGGGPSLVANFTGSGLVVSHAYQFEFGYTDAQGNTVKSSKVSATTASQFKPSEGQAYQGGFLAFQNFGDGDLFDLVVAPKSTEASKVWNGNTSSILGTYSRLNGLGNTETISQSVGGGTAIAASYARNGVTIGGVAGYLGAIDELRAIASKLKPSAAVEAAFKAGGAEAFVANSSYWASTELDASSAYQSQMGNNADSQQTSAKTSNGLVRAIKRVSTIAPYPIGTQMEGGTLAAYFTDLSSFSPVTYMLIVAPKSTEVIRVWDTATSGMLGFTSRTRGLRSSNTALQALNYTASLNSGGKTDWYLGAIDEMLAIARMNSQLPSGQQLIANSQDVYSTSTEIDASNNKIFKINTNGSVLEQPQGKSVLGFVRPIRRVLLPTA